MVRITVFAIALGVCGVAAAQSAPSMNSNEQWACEVAMCLSNPSGPMAVKECEKPIKKMLREQAKGRVIPKCKFLSSGNGGGGNSGGGGDRDVIVRQQQQ